jgi:hypothetical protein
LTEFDFEAEFELAFNAAIAEERAGSPLFPIDDWFVAGFRPRQDLAWWDANGPDMAKAYADWFTSHPEVSVWRAPDGRPAIELDLTVNFGHIPVRMKIDQVLKVGTALVVVDVKSGGHIPDDEHRQLATYACGIEQAYGVRPKYGTYFMARGIANKKDDTKRHFLPPVTLDGVQHSREYLSQIYYELSRQVEEGYFLASPGPLCRTCGVSDSCAAVGGPLADKHDPSHPDYREDR